MKRREQLGGGQDLLTTMKSFIERPPRVVNLKTIKGLDHITDDGKGGLKIGATATLTAVNEHPEIQKRFPGLSEAALDRHATDPEHRDARREFVPAAAAAGTSGSRT